MLRSSAVLFLVACGMHKVDFPDDTAGITCGEGTHLEGGTCVADADTGGDADSGTDIVADTDTGADSGADSDTGEAPPSCDVDASGGATYTDIQDAVDAASDGDTIRVCAGTYGPVDLERIDLTLVGVDGSDTTIIDGGSKTALTIADTPTEDDVQGFTFTGYGLKSQDVCAILASHAVVTMNDIQVKGCTSSAGISVLGTQWEYSTLDLDGAVFENNTITSPLIYAESESAMVVRHSIFRNNGPPEGNASGSLVTFLKVDVEFSNNLLYNDIGDSSDPINFDGDSATAWVYNNTFYNISDPETTGTGDSVLVYNGVQFFNNIIVKTTHGLDGSAASTEYNDSYGNTTHDYTSSVSGDGNLEEDPMFNDASGGDFTLRSGFSPCIDAGDPLSGYDDVDGTRNDMGAYGGPFGAW